MKNAVYFQSGGPTSVINSSFYGVIVACQEDERIDKLYGARYGLEGLLNKDLVLIDEPYQNYQELTTLSGAILGSARLLLPSSFEEEAYRNLGQFMDRDGNYIIYQIDVDLENRGSNFTYNMLCKAKNLWSNLRLGG